MPRMWGIVNENGSLIAATHAGQLVFDLQKKLEADIGSNLHDATASAIRINVNYRVTGSSEGDDTTIALGIGWVSNAAFAVAGVSVPDPVEDHFDWMFHDIRTFSSAIGATDVDEAPRNSMIEIRNNSMRKQRENNSKLVLVTRAVLLQPTSCQVFLGGRVLFLNP